MKKTLIVIIVIFYSFFQYSLPSFSYQADNTSMTIQRILQDNDTENVVVFNFYEERAFNPYWLNKPKAIIDLLLVFKNGPKQGLPSERYSYSKILELKSSELESKQAELDILLTNMFLLYAKDVSVGIIDPTSINSFIKINREDLLSNNYISGLKEYPEIIKFLTELEPDDPDYIKLQLELEKRLSLIGKNDSFELLPIETTLEVGMSHPNVLLLRTRLINIEYLEEDNLSETFDKELLKAVKNFQENSGLTADGVVGRKTIQALNIPNKTRIIQILVNLERMRWLNFDLGPNYVMVNQPNYKAKLVKKDAVIWESNVVIGLPDYQTAEFFDQMTHIIVNPTWHVPKSIAVDEYLPQIQNDPEFLANNEMQLYVRGTTKVIDSNLIDMSVFTVDNFPFEIKQNPGNINALGQVKFMFPNKFSIYMHDTPMKPLFAKDLRAFSHGCVRVERPFEFANALLTDNENIKYERFYSALNSGEETQLNLVEAIPVYLTYRTVIVDNFGDIQYRPDVYGRDALLYMLLKSSGLKLEG